MGICTDFGAKSDSFQPKHETHPSFLSVSGNSLTYEGKPVFLSGANQPWIDYGNDFGNNQSNGIRCGLNDYIKNVSQAGGNSVRIWIFVEGSNIPAFDSNGNCIGTDGTNTLADDLTQYARYAASQNVFITLCLWNAAVVKSDDHVFALMQDENKLQGFIDEVGRSVGGLVRGLWVVDRALTHGKGNERGNAWLAWLISISDFRFPISTN